MAHRPRAKARLRCAAKRSQAPEETRQRSYALYRPLPAKGCSLIFGPGFITDLPI
jgi:hypothetical protein